MTLRQIRDSLNLTQGEIANKLGMTISAYSNYETGTIPSPLDGSTDVSLSPTLSWSCNDPENDPMTYDVYWKSQWL
jgi:DNA-binding XRE family transcriptional regulator